MGRARGKPHINVNTDETMVTRYLQLSFNVPESFAAREVDSRRYQYFPALSTLLKRT